LEPARRCSTMVMGWLRRTKDDGCETSCCPECDAEVDTRLTYCTVCGFDIVQQAKIDLAHPPRMI
jgi:hypothetical protein